MEIRKKFNEFIDKLLEDRADKLILFIDELDRCSPLFAVRLLERIKFLFDHERVILVFSTNADQLSFMVKKMYGQCTDGHAYLQRFYDMKFTLPDATEKYAKALLAKAGNLNDWYGYNLLNVLKDNSCSLRDVNRYQQELETGLEGLLRRNSHLNAGFIEEDDRRFLLYIILPVLLFIKVTDGQAYTEILSGKGEKQFAGYLSDNVMFKRFPHPQKEVLVPNTIYKSCFTNESFESGCPQYRFREEYKKIESQLNSEFFAPSQSRKG
jgi:hypothetical protein